MTNTLNMILALCMVILILRGFFKGGTNMILPVISFVLGVMFTNPVCKMTEDLILPVIQGAVADAFSSMGFNEGSLVSNLPSYVQNLITSNFDATNWLSVILFKLLIFAICSAAISAIGMAVRHAGMMIPGMSILDKVLGALIGFGEFYIVSALTGFFGLTTLSVSGAISTCSGWISSILH